MATAIDRIDIVSKGKDRLAETFVVLDSDFDAGRAVGLLRHDGAMVERVATLIQVSHEAGEAAFEVEGTLSRRRCPLVG